VYLFGQPMERLAVAAEVGFQAGRVVRQFHQPVAADHS
jgi:hypothetical protein